MQVGWIQERSDAAPANTLVPELRIARSGLQKVAERRNAIASDFSPRCLWIVIESRGAATGVGVGEHLPSLRDFPGFLDTHLGLKSEAVICRCSAT
jgi:hypothetical protein